MKKPLFILLSSTLVLTLSSCWQEKLPEQKPIELPPVPAVFSTSTKYASGELLEKKVTYNTPEWQETADFNINLDSEWKVLNVSVSINSRERETKMAMENFNAEINKKVVGKKLSEISLDAIGWASLTTEAFKKALTSN